MDRRDFLKTFALGATLAALTGVASAQGVTRGGVMLGIDVLEARGFSDIRGLRCGLVTNPAGVNRHGQRSMDVLLRAKSRGVKLVKLFGPEHGIYGTEKAEIPVQNTIDRRTGLPVFSLYGKTRKPTPEMLTGLDAMLIDLQDVGCRSYTYISCMRLVIEACFEADVQVIVLDRPNPMGGEIVDGPGLDKEFQSYVGMYPVPYVYGLTIGELALMAVRSKGWLDLTAQGRKNSRLRVIPMRGWTRNMQWEDTGLRWVPTSPKIPDVAAAKGYSMTGLGCQLGDFYHGYGALYPFRWVGYPKRTGAELARVMRACAVPGLSPDPRHMPDGGQGVYLEIVNKRTLRPTEISFHMMRIACAWSRKNPFAAATPGEALLFNKHVGSKAWFNEIKTKGAKADVMRFILQWRKDAAAFKASSKPFYLYN